MEVLLILLVVAIALWINYLIAKEFYLAAQAKGYAGKKYLWLPFWLGIIGYLLVIALPDRGNTPKNNIDELPDL